MLSSQNAWKTEAAQRALGREGFRPSPDSLAMDKCGASDRESQTSRIGCCRKPQRDEAPCPNRDEVRESGVGLGAPVLQTTGFLSPSCSQLLTCGPLGGEL